MNYSILTQTPDPVDLELSVDVVKSFWESRGFTTRTETNPKDPGLIRLYAKEDGGRLVSYFANIKGSGLEMNSACIAGNQNEIALSGEAISMDRAAVWSQFLPALHAAINWANKLRRRARIGACRVRTLLMQ